MLLRASFLPLAIFFLLFIFCWIDYYCCWTLEFYPDMEQTMDGNFSLQTDVDLLLDGLSADTVDPSISPEVDDNADDLQEVTQEPTQDQSDEIDEETQDNETMIKIWIMFLMGKT